MDTCERDTRYDNQMYVVIIGIVDTCSSCSVAMLNTEYPILIRRIMQCLETHHRYVNAEIQPHICQCITDVDKPSRLGDHECWCGHSWRIIQAHTKTDFMLGEEIDRLMNDKRMTEAERYDN